jgi:hypothetical protein
MTNLNFGDYIKDDLTRLFSDTGAFYAFSESQYNEQAQKGVRYVRAQMGLYVPMGEKYKQFFDRLDAIYTDKGAEFFQLQGLEKIAKYEFWNYETAYTGDTSDAREALAKWQTYTGLTDSEYQDELSKIFKNCFKYAVDNDLI